MSVKGDSGDLSGEQQARNSRCTTPANLHSRGSNLQSHGHGYRMSQRVPQRWPRVACNRRMQPLSRLAREIYWGQRVQSSPPSPFPGRKGHASNTNRVHSSPLFVREDACARRNESKKASYTLFRARLFAPIRASINSSRVQE